MKRWKHSGGNVINAGQVNLFQKSLKSISKFYKFDNAYLMHVIKRMTPVIFLFYKPILLR